MSSLGSTPPDTHDSDLDQVIAEPKTLEISDVETLTVARARELEEQVRSEKVRDVVFANLKTVEPGALRTLDLWDISLVNVKFPELAELTGDNLSGVAAFEASAEYVGRREVTFGSNGQALRDAVDHMKGDMSAFGKENDPTGYLAHYASRAVTMANSEQLDALDYEMPELTWNIGNILTRFNGSILRLNNVTAPKASPDAICTLLANPRLKRVEFTSLDPHGISFNGGVADYIREFEERGGVVVFGEPSDEPLPTADTAAAVHAAVAGAEEPVAEEEPTSVLARDVEDANRNGKNTLVYHSGFIDFSQRDSEEIGRFLGSVIELRGVEYFRGNSFTALLNYPQNLRELRIPQVAYDNLDDTQRAQIVQPNFHNIIVRVTVEYDKPTTTAPDKTVTPESTPLAPIEPEMEVTGEPRKIVGLTRRKLQEALLGAAGIVTILGTYTAGLDYLISHPGEKSPEKAPVVAKTTEAQDLILSGKTKLDDTISFSTVDEYVKKGYITLDKDGTPWPAERFTWKNPEVPLDLNKPETLAVVRSL